MTLMLLNCMHLAIRGGTGARRIPHRCLSVNPGLVCVDKHKVQEIKEQLCMPVCGTQTFWQESINPTSICRYCTQNVTGKKKKKKDNYSSIFTLGKAERGY